MIELGMVHRKYILVSLIVLGGFLLVSPPDANAQRWLQTSQLLVPVETDGPARALMDTLVQVIDRKDDVQVKRAPDGEEEFTISELRDRLIEEDGIGLTSANYVFIDYRFEIKNRGFEESIEGFNFVYRPGEGLQDVQMMYVDTSKPWVSDILNKKGTTLTTNEAALRTFSDQLAFARMHSQGDIVEIAGETVREGREAKKRNLVQKITRLTYESM